MRNRFFFIILATLILGAAGINLIEIYFFKHQRIDLIDRQIERSASGLLGSGEFRASTEKLSDLEDTISRVIGSDRIGKVFIIKDENGKALYQSTNMEVMQVELPTSPEWVTIQEKDQYVRLLNRRLSPTRILQVGLVLDHNFVNWSIVNQDTVIFISALVIALFAAAAILTIILLSPIRLLNSHLLRATSDLSNLKDVDPLPSNLLQLSGGFWSKSDEFASLVTTVEKLISRINQNYKLTRSWTLQMAHELKTPLAIIRAEAESQGAVPAASRAILLAEIDWMSETITQFLTWAELENSQPQRTLHVLRVGSVVSTVRERLGPICKQKINIEVKEEVSVAASPGHLDQLVANILGNACKFAPPESEISVIVGRGSLVIEDSGPGIPREVLERMGEPFNVGSAKSARRIKGNGLGLAWVKTVAKLYGWQLRIDSSSTGTRVEVEFPALVVEG